MRLPTLAEAAGLAEAPSGFWGKAALWWATGFGSGRLPVAPGTWGTLLVGVPAWWVPRLLGRWVPGLESWFLLAVIVASLAACQRLVGGGKADPGGIVADEVAGFLVAAWQVPLPWLPVAFVLFRVMDIVKPWPARALERLGGAVGIVADDLAAGFYAAMLLRAGWLLAGWLQAGGGPA